MRIRAVLRGSLDTATHGQPLPYSPPRISFPTSCLILLAFVLSMSASSTLYTSTVQYKVFVKVDGVVCLDCSRDTGVAARRVTRYIGIRWIRALLLDAGQLLFKDRHDLPLYDTNDFLL